MLARSRDGGGFVALDEVRDPARRGVHVGASERLRIDLLEQDLLDHLRSGHEHQGVGPRKDDEVRDRRRIHGAPCAWPEHDGDLRYPPGQTDVSAEDLSVSRERRHAFLDAGASRVEQGDDRRADALGEIHGLADLEGVGLAERPAHEAPILRERDDDLPVHATRRDADAVAVGALPVHAPVARLMMDERVELFVASVIEELRQPAGGWRDRVKRAVRALVGGRRCWLGAERTLVDTRLDNGGGVGHRTPSVCPDDLPSDNVGATSIRARHFSRYVAGPTRKRVDRLSRIVGEEDVVQSESHSPVGKRVSMHRNRWLGACAADERQRQVGDGSPS